MKRDKRLEAAAVIAAGVVGSYAFYRWLRSYAGMEGERMPLFVDFDGTIAKDLFPKAGAPEPYVKEAFTKLKEKYIINIYSCRTNSHWKDIFKDYSVNKQKEFIETYMRRNKIPYDKVEIRDKPVGIIIGDECIEYKRNWREILGRLTKH